MLNKLKRAALGAHTPHDKATAASKPVPMPLPAQVRILMSQHIGAPAKALVKKGDEVFVGTKIGEAGGFVSANIHSSVSGTVAAVEPFRLSNGRMCDSVVIKTDGKQTVDPAVKAPEVTDKASFLAAVRECGLVGLGGAGFPTDVKLQPKQTVDTLLINASECEVWLTSDTQEMLNCSDDIVRGIEAVLKYTGIPKCVIGIENNKPECIELLNQKTKDKPAIEVKALPSVYGTGAELILIEKCLGREVPHGGLPADAGAIVMNVTSVSTLGKYLATGMPVVSLVGYTNVGKSSLMNALCGPSVAEADMLFATLDPTSRKLVLPSGMAVLLVDTVGFVSRLPHNLVEAFKSTLEEAAWSDVIVRVADAGDDQREEQLAVTDEVLDGLDCADIPRLTVYNKCDKPNALNFDPDILLTSAKTGYGLDALLKKLDELLSDRVHTIRVLLPYDKLGLAAPLRERGSVQVEEYREDGLYLEGIVKTEDLHCFEGFLV